MRSFEPIIVLGSLLIPMALGFVGSSAFARRTGLPFCPTAFYVQAAASKDDIADAEVDLTPDEMSLKDKKSAIGNLVADDEWAGVTMELGELVKTAVMEDLKAKSREFLGKDEYKLGDLSIEIDSRVKEGVASIRGKSNYDIGDLTIALDEMSKNFTANLTGKPYEAGDLSIEIDSRIKKAVAGYVGKDDYEAGDLTKAVKDKVVKRVDELLANYEFGDITREIDRRRIEWIKDLLGEDAAAKYKFGDVSKKLATMFTGKDEYQFGDVSKKLFGGFLGNKKSDKT